MSRYLMTVAAILSLATPPLAAVSQSGDHGHGPGHEEMSIGRPGDASQVDRVVEITMVETDDGRMIFEPSELELQKGETIRFEVTNGGVLEHELVLGTPGEIQEHKAEMKEAMDMAHDDPNSVRLQPGESGEIIWTFANEGTFEFACLIPGHYESGMHGPLVVTAGVQNPSPSEPS